MFLHRAIAKSVAVLIAITMLFTSIAFTSVTQPFKQTLAEASCHPVQLEQSMMDVMTCCGKANSSPMANQCHSPVVDSDDTSPISCCGDHNCQMGSSSFAAILPTSISLNLQLTVPVFDDHSGNRVASQTSIFRPPLYA